MIGNRKTRSQIENDGYLSIHVADPPSWALFRGEDGRLFQERICFWALSAEGEVVPLTACEDCGLADPRICQDFIGFQHDVAHRQFVKC